jgi:hypothetical protein
MSGRGQLGRDRRQRLRVLSETSFPMVAGIVMALAEVVNPPAPTVFPASVHEIELERFVREEVDPCDVGRGFQEFRDELGVPLGGNGGESDCGKDEKPWNHRKGGGGWKTEERGSERFIPCLKMAQLLTPSGHSGRSVRTERFQIKACEGAIR